MNFDLERFTAPPSENLVAACKLAEVGDIGLAVDFNEVFQCFLTTKTFPDSISTFLKSCSIIEPTDWWKAPLTCMDELIGGRPGYLYDLWIINENIRVQRLGVLIPKQKLHTIGSTSVAHANTTFLMNILGIEQARDLLRIGKFLLFSNSSWVSLHSRRSSNLF